MSSLLKSTKNTRAVLPGSLKLIRSDVPYQISEEDVAWLKENAVTTVVDLRSEEERERKICSLKDDPAFTYHCMPVTGGDRVPDAPELVADSYISMVDEQMENILNTILSSRTNVLYFCNAGKDRTGVVSALLLKRFGMTDEYIVNDYVESAINLKELLEQFAASTPGIDLNVITPKREYMEQFLNWWNTEHAAENANVTVQYAELVHLPCVNELRRMVNELHVNGRPDIFRPGFCRELQDIIYPRYEAETSDVIVALKGGIVCGYAMVAYVEKELSPYNLARFDYHISEFGVSENFRREGIAGKLIEFCKAEARKKGAGRVELDMWEFNESAGKFYESVGFQTYRRYLEIQL